VIAEFNWWLLIVGLVIGAALVWLVLSDSRRRETDIAAEELPKEAAWIAETLRQSGRRIDPETAERVLRLHRTYLASLPPDELGDDEFADDEWAEAALDQEPSSSPDLDRRLGGRRADEPRVAERTFDEPGRDDRRPEAPRRPEPAERTGRLEASGR
jgi:hypothetical protein